MYIKTSCLRFVSTFSSWIKGKNSILFYKHYIYKDSVTIANSLSLIKMNDAIDVDFNLKITTTFNVMPQF